MDLRPPTVRALLEHLERLPGVGPRTAQRLAEHLLTVDPVSSPEPAISAVPESLALRLGDLATVTIAVENSGGATAAAYLDLTASPELDLIGMSPVTGWH